VPLPPWRGKVGMGGDAGPLGSADAHPHPALPRRGGGKLSSSDADAIPTPVRSGRGGEGQAGLGRVLAVFRLPYADLKTAISHCRGEVQGDNAQEIVLDGPDTALTACQGRLPLQPLSGPLSGLSAGNSRRGAARGGGRFP
jgi:hypothetical protein